MDRYLLCLANSYKRGGRCVAGVEVRQENGGRWRLVRDEKGNVKWVRPIASTEFGEIPNSKALLVSLFSIVKLTEVEAMPQDAHVEDVRYGELEVVDYRPITEKQLEQFVDIRHSKIFGNKGKAISDERVESVGYSLMLVKVWNMMTYRVLYEDNERPKVRMRFIYCGVEYDLPVTDPGYLDRVQMGQVELDKEVEYGYLTLSLGLEHEGWHHKLVAAVVEPRNESEEEPNDVNVEQIDEKSVIKKYPKAVKGELKEADSDVFSIWKDLKEVKKEILQLEKKKVEWELKIKQEMKTAESLIMGRETLVTWKSAKSTMKFNERHFAEDHPDLYKSYLEEKEGVRRFVINMKDEQQTDNGK